MDDSKQTADLAVNIVGAPVKREPSLKERMKDPARWKKSLTEVGMWFLYGGILTTLLSMYAPGYPIVVGTSSISPGLYWLDRTAFTYPLDSYVSFDFKPSQTWLQERYGMDRVFTKIVKGVPGDTVYADADLKLKVCHTLYGGEQHCQDIGQALVKDSLGRPMTPWVPANHHYTLREGELWVYAPNAKSLDSRYYGPIVTSAVHGTATPIFFW
jgi:type IV secretory pathway protease TraF